MAAGVWWSRLAVAGGRAPPPQPDVLAVWVSRRLLRSRVSEVRSAALTSGGVTRIQLNQIQFVSRHSGPAYPHVANGVSGPSL